MTEIEMPEWATHHTTTEGPAGGTVHVFMYVLQSVLGKYCAAVVQIDATYPDGRHSVGEPYVFFDPYRYDGWRIPGDEENELYRATDVMELIPLLERARAKLDEIQRTGSAPPPLSDVQPMPDQLTLPGL